MEMTKEEVKMAIDFLETIPNEDFIANQQTLDFEKQYIGKKHCVFGHLAVNPRSPFYNTDLLVKSHTETNGIEGIVDAICESTSPELWMVNNNASDENRKAEVLDKLTEYYNSLV